MHILRHLLQLNSNRTVAGFPVQRPYMALQNEAVSKVPSNPGSVQSILTRSARGASFLISLQIGSRAFTFVINQVLVRFLSPELLGLSSQLELFSITVLTFARESIRVSLGRSGSLGQAPENDNKSGTRQRKQEAESYRPSRKAQEAINLSYLALALGPVIALFLSWFRRPEPAVLATPYNKESFALYAAATILELCMEPCFAVAAQQTLFKTRAAAETGATFTRCVLNCGIAVWASRAGLSVGALPFAIGQVGYAVVLNAVYYYHIYPRSKVEGYSLSLRPMHSNLSTLIASRFPRRHFNLALSLYAQSGLKHILTQGDSLLITWFTDLRSQGIYALASNYGSLLARMLFQPIEESSRGVFGGLCSSAPPPRSGSSDEQSPPHPNLLTAQKYLVTVLRLYSLLSCCLIFIAPTFLPPVLPLLAGSRFGFSSGAPQVLGLYAYYLPLLAFNGLLEAFVAAVATPKQLRWQAIAMMVFSFVFAAAGSLVLGSWDGGAKGLVVVNCINMTVRIIWSYEFVRGYFGERGVDLAIHQFLPRAIVTTLGICITTGLKFMSKGHHAGTMEVLQVGGIGVVYGLSLLFFERRFLAECYRMLKPSSGRRSTDQNNLKKEL